MGDQIIVMADQMMADLICLMAVMDRGRGAQRCRRYKGMKGEPLLCHKLTPSGRE